MSPLSLLLALSLQSAPESAALTTAPKEVRVTGAFVTGLRWKEAGGEHLVVLSTVGPVKQTSTERYAELHGAHWQQVKGQWQQVWKLSDHVEACPLDLTCEFVPASLTLSDADGNGVPEVSVLYRLGCQGGVDPATLKLLLYEGPRKFALRGTEKLVTPDGTFGGELTVDPAFEHAPAAVLAFAREQWARLGTRRVP